MKMRTIWPGIILATFLPLAVALESDPLPVPKGSPREHAIGLYNDGVLLMLQKHYVAAQQKFEAALALHEAFPEAHNNLAFSLRVQSSRHLDRAMRHYDRALSLKPDLRVAYVYRGALYVQLGELDRARADHARLVALDAKLAERLARVIAGAPPSEAFEGLAAQYD
jgi:tetratricopeptide (TPR) repeat protein